MDKFLLQSIVDDSTDYYQHIEENRDGGIIKMLGSLNQSIEGGKLDVKVASKFWECIMYYSLNK